MLLSVSLRLRSTGVGEKVLLHDFCVFIGENHCSPGVPDKLIGSLDHAVTLSGSKAFHLAAGRDLESLLGTALRLELGHLALLNGRNKTRQQGHFRG